MKPKHPAGSPMTLGNVRALGGARAQCFSAGPYSPLSSHDIGLSDGPIPNRASSAAAVKLKTSIATNTSPTLVANHRPWFR